MSPMLWQQKASKATQAICCPCGASRLHRRTFRRRGEMYGFMKKKRDRLIPTSACRTVRAPPRPEKGSPSYSKMYAIA